MTRRRLTPPDVTPPVPYTSVPLREIEYLGKRYCPTDGVLTRPRPGTASPSTSPFVASKGRAQRPPASSRYRMWPVSTYLGSKPIGFNSRIVSGREIDQDEAAGNPASERRPATGKQMGMNNRLSPADSRVLTPRVGYPKRARRAVEYDRPVVAPMGEIHSPAHTSRVHSITQSRRPIARGTSDTSSSALPTPPPW